jgi:hypothetical protein
MGARHVCRAGSGNGERGSIDDRERVGKLAKRDRPWRHQSGAKIGDGHSCPSVTTNEGGFKPDFDYLIRTCTPQAAT